MSVKHVCDICEGEMSQFESGFVTINYSDGQKIRFDICEKCAKKIFKQLSDYRIKAKGKEE
jgi:protein-arginine kinase activator protein McsA